MLKYLLTHGKISRETLTLITLRPWIRDFLKINSIKILERRHKTSGFGSLLNSALGVLFAKESDLSRTAMPDCFFLFKIGFLFNPAFLENVSMKIHTLQNTHSWFLRIFLRMRAGEFISYNVVNSHLNGKNWCFSLCRNHKEYNGSGISLCFKSTLITTLIHTAL